MKSFMIFMVLSIFTVASEQLYISIYKETNGDYLICLPTYEIETKNENIFTKDKISLLFTAPREDKTDLNHYGIEASKEFGVVKSNYFVSFSLDMLYRFEENSKKEPVGFEFGNTLKFGVKID